MAIKQLWVLGAVALSVALAPLALACETSRSALPCGGMADPGAAPPAAGCPLARAHDPAQPSAPSVQAAKSWPAALAVLPGPRLAVERVSSPPRRQGRPPLAPAGRHGPGIAPLRI